MRDASKLVRRISALRLLATDVRVKRLPRDVLHDEDRPIRARSEVVDAAHVGVTDRARKNELLSQCLVVAGHARFFADNLERDRLLGRAVIREKDFAHPSFAEALANLVTVVDDRSVR